MLARAQGAVARAAAYFRGRQDIEGYKLTLDAHPSNGYPSGTLGNLLHKNQLQMSASSSRRSGVGITQEDFDMLLQGKCEDKVDYSLRYINHQLRHLKKSKGDAYFVTIKLTVRCPAVRQARDKSKQPASRTAEPPERTLKIVSLVEAPVILTYHTRTRGRFSETLEPYRCLAPDDPLNTAANSSA